MASAIASSAAASGGTGSRPTHGSSPSLEWGWALSGALHATTGQPLAALLEGRLATPLGIRGEICLAVPPSAERRVATHDASALMRQGGLELSEITLLIVPRRGLLMTAGTLLVGGLDLSEMMLGGGGDDDGDDDDGDDEGGAAAGESDHAPPSAAGDASPAGPPSMLDARRLVELPPLLNMARLRAACLPGASMHSSARALATFYEALGAGRLLSPGALGSVRKLAGSGSAGKHESGALGFQFGGCTSDVRRDRLLALGAAGVGGSLGLCVPEAGLALGITVSKLSASRLATRRLCELALSEVGLRLEHGPLLGDEGGT